MPLEAILWDNDGVLVDTERLYFEASAELLATVGFELTQEAYIQTSLTEGSSLFHLVDLSEVEFKRLRDARNERYGQLLLSGGLTIDGAEETLSLLHGRLRMMMVTSSRREHFQMIHKSTGFMRFFEGVVDNEDYERSKPNPDPYLKGLERLGLAADDCVAVEDSARGMTAAVRAGLRCIVVPNKLTQDCDFSDALWVLDDVREVASVVEELM